MGSRPPPYQPPGVWAVGRPTLPGGPVWLRPLRATPFFILLCSSILSLSLLFFRSCNSVFHNISIIFVVVFASSTFSGRRLVTGFWLAGCLSCQPINSVKALRKYRAVTPATGLPLSVHHWMPHEKVVAAFVPTLHCQNQLDWCVDNMI